MHVLQYGGQTLLSRGIALAEDLRDPQARCQAFLDLALAQKRLGMESDASLDKAVSSAEGEPNSVNQIGLFCDIALAQPLFGGAPAPFLRHAQALVSAGTPEGGFRCALTETLLVESSQQSFVHAVEEAKKLPTSGLRAQAFADIAFSQMKAGDRDAAHDMILFIEDAYEATHMYAELALEEHRAGRDASRLLEEARRMAEGLREKDHSLEARCFIAVALSSMDRVMALQMLLVIQDEADALMDSVPAARVNCQIAAAKAQMGYVEEAKLRAERIPESSYRDSAWRSIAAEEAKQGLFDKAIETAKRMRTPHLRELALARVIGWMARTSAKDAG